MEAKKTEKADLMNKSNLFLSVGLLITMASVVTVFEWKTTEEREIDSIGKTTNVFEEVLEVPPTDQPPPPPAPTIEQPNVVEVPDEEEIEEMEVKFDTEVTDDSRVDQQVVAKKVEEEPEEKVDEVFTIVENPASPEGGMAAFYKYVSDNIKYPAQARRMGVEGRVFVEFVVDKDGSITDVKAVKGIGAQCDEEAVRIIQSAPRWTPGKQRGKPVRQRMVLPITFKLG